MVPLNGITSVPNFINIYESVQTLLAGTHTDGQTGDMISLLSFLESMLQNNACYSSLYSGTGYPHTFPYLFK
jgi:hypothetical protein